MTRLLQAPQNPTGVTPHYSLEATREVMLLMSSSPPVAVGVNLSSYLRSPMGSSTQSAGLYTN